MVWGEGEEVENAINPPITFVDPLVKKMNGLPNKNTLDNEEEKRAAKSDVEKKNMNQRKGFGVGKEKA